MRDLLIILDSVRYDRFMEAASILSGYLPQSDIGQPYKPIWACAFNMKRVLEYYKRHALPFDFDRYKAYPDHRVRLNHVIKRVRELGIKGRILDVGCGNTPLKNLWPDYVGLDFLCDRKPGPGEYIRGEWTYLPFRSDVFDAAFWLEGPEHALNLESVLKEITRVLKPNGFFIASTTDNPRGKKPPIHVHIYSPKELLDQIKPFFKDCRVYKVKNWIFLEAKL